MDRIQHADSTSRPGTSRVVGILCLSFLLAVVSSAQTSAPDRPFLNFPRELPPWKLARTIGFSLAYIPKIISEEEINYSPLVDLQLRLGLPYQFSTNARVSTIGITNHFQIGGQWSHSFGSFSFGAGYDFAYWVGFFNVSGFDVVANGTMNYPFIVVGYDFDDVFVSLRTEAQIVTFSETFVGEASVGGITRKLAGFTFIYTLEQPFLKNTHIVQGVKLNVTKFFYQSWISFSPLDRYIVFPEFIIGVHL